MIHAETIPRLGGRAHNKESLRGWIQEGYIWYIVKVFVNVTIYYHPAQSKQDKEKKGTKRCIVNSYSCDWDTFYVFILFQAPMPS
jgi:hypothetical protein